MGCDTGPWCYDRRWVLVGLVLGRDLNFWIMTEVFQVGKEKVVATGLATRFRLGLGHLGHDRNFGVATGPWGRWMVLGRDRGRCIYALDRARLCA